MNERLLITNCFEMSDAKLSKLTDQDITNLAYGIKYFSFYAACITPTDRDFEVMSILQTRLANLEAEIAASAKKTTDTNEYVECDCGHMVQRTLVMNPSSGTCCPDCYDRMSY